MKRLNHNFLRDDLESYLLGRISSCCMGSNYGVLEWLKQYDADINKTIAEIKSRVESIRPSAIVRIEGSFDDGSTYFVRIYGVNKDDTDYELQDLCLSITENELGNKYLLIPSLISLPAVEQYYPDIYQEYVKKNSP